MFLGVCVYAILNVLLRKNDDEKLHNLVTAVILFPLSLFSTNTQQMKTNNAVVIPNNEKCAIISLTCVCNFLISVTTIYSHTHTRVTATEVINYSHEINMCSLHCCLWTDNILTCHRIVLNNIILVVLNFFLSDTWSIWWRSIRSKYFNIIKFQRERLLQASYNFQRI